jgi:hypothetical protein
MTQSEVINKLSMEMALALGELDHLQTCRTYIQMALVIGIEHFEKESEEIIQYSTSGEEIERHKSIRNAAQKTGLDRRNIQHVLNGTAHTAGGFIFMNVKDRELPSARKTA